MCRAGCSIGRLVGISRGEFARLASAVVAVAIVVGLGQSTVGQRDIGTLIRGQRNWTAVFSKRTLTW